MNRQITKTVLTFFLFLTSSMVIEAQQKFSVASFNLDQFDLTARNDQHKKIDGNGSLYAIIKVTSSNPDDKLSEYHFNFGNMNHEVVNRDGELWVYVQRNAKFVTISRQGFTTINKHDLGTTIEEGRTYNMRLASKMQTLQTQMVMFKIAPPSERPVITVKGSQVGAVEEMLDMDMIDESGLVAKNMPLGTYTYKVMCVGYYPTEGQFVLADKTKTHLEEVTLRPRFSETTLTVDADADIYVNGELKGRRTWKGRLNKGDYNIECRQLNHRSVTQRITVVEGAASSFTLTPPTPITGSLSIITNPLNANVYIDGQPHGTTPQNINDLLIGQHTVTLSKEGYADENIDVMVTEGEMADINRRLMKGKAVAVVQAAALQEQAKTVGNQELYTKYRNRWATKRWIGWLSGASLVALGGVFSIVDTEDELLGPILIASGVPVTATFLTLAHFDKKKANRYHSDPYRLYTKRANTRLWTGVIGGAALVAAGAALWLATEGEDDLRAAEIGLASGGLIWGASHLVCSLGDRKKAKRYKATVFQTNDFKLNDGSSLSASIDVLKDGINNKHTLGLGLQYNF